MAARESDWLYLRRLLITVGVIGLAYLAWRLSGLLLLLFAAILMATLLSWAADLVEAHSPMASSWALGVGGLLVNFGSPKSRQTCGIVPRSGLRPGQRRRASSTEWIGGRAWQLGGLLGGASAGSVLSGGLGDLVERFRQAGQGEAAESWIRRGPNQQVAPDQLERAIGPEILDDLVQRTGLSRQELLSRLTQVLPEAVDKLTPDGRLPTETEANRFSQL